SCRQPPPGTPDQDAAALPTSLGLALGDDLGDLAPVLDLVPGARPGDEFPRLVVALDEARDPLGDVRVRQRGAADRAVRECDLVVPDPVVAWVVHAVGPNLDLHVAMSFLGWEGLVNGTWACASADDPGAGRAGGRSPRGRGTPTASGRTARRAGTDAVAEGEPAAAWSCRSLLPVRGPFEHLVDPLAADVEALVDQAGLQRAGVDPVQHRLVVDPEQFGHLLRCQDVELAHDARRSVAASGEGMVSIDTPSATASLAATSSLAARPLCTYLKVE